MVIVRTMTIKVSFKSQCAKFPLVMSSSPYTIPMIVNDYLHIRRGYESTTGDYASQWHLQGSRTVVSCKLHFRLALGFLIAYSSACVKDNEEDILPTQTYA